MSEFSTRAFVGLGSNLGDRDAKLAFGLRSIAELRGVVVAAASGVYETRPLGPPQADYLNAVLELRTALSAQQLLGCLLAIERKAGRLRPRDASERCGPRTLDLDLLLYADQQIREPDLEVPHPRLHERAFVLIPLCALAPELRHPRLGDSIRTLRARLCDLDRAGVRPWPRPLPIPSAAGSG